MAKERPNAEPQSPDELLKLINNQSKDVEKVGPTGETIFDPGLQIEVPPPAVDVVVNGFVTRMARDVFQATGDRDQASRTDALVQLLGNEEQHVFNTKAKGSKEEIAAVGLYDRVRVAATCHGQDDESLWLRQHIWLVLEREEASLEGATEPRVKEVDDNANSPDNQLIAAYLGASQLGRIRALASAAGVSNKSAFKAIVLNYLQSMRTL